MKRVILIGLSSVLFTLSVISQSTQGWTNTELMSFYGGYLFSNYSDKKSVFSTEFLKFSTSFGRASNYQKFGIGTALFEGNVVGNYELVTFLPLYLHFIPYIKFRTYEFQPIERVTYNSDGSITQYYDPLKTDYEDGASSYIDITLISTLWGMGDEKTKPDGTIDILWNLKYFNARIAFIKNLRIKGKGTMGVSNGFGFYVSTEINNYMILENHEVRYVPSIGLRISMGSILEFY